MSHIQRDAKDLYASHQSGNHWPIYLIDSESSHIICMLWAHYVLKKNPAMKTLLLTVLLGRAPDTLSDADCRGLTIAPDLQTYSTM